MDKQQKLTLTLSEMTFPIRARYCTQRTAKIYGAKKLFESLYSQNKLFRGGIAVSEDGKHYFVFETGVLEWIRILFVRFAIRIHPHLSDLELNFFARNTRKKLEKNC